MAATEAEVKRLLADIRGKTLVAARRGAVERLRALLTEGASSRSRTSKNAVRAAADGLLSLIVDATLPADVRDRCASVLDDCVGFAGFKQWTIEATWATEWTEELFAILGDRSAPTAARRLASQILEAHALEHSSLVPRVTTALMAELADPANTGKLRLSCLEALVDMHRSSPDWLVQHRPPEAAETISRSSWRSMSAEDQTLAAVLADSRHLEEIVRGASIDTALAALSMVVLHARYVPSGARPLVAEVARMLATAEIPPETTTALGLHAAGCYRELLSAAIAHDRFRGRLDLGWVSSQIVHATTLVPRILLEDVDLPREETIEGVADELDALAHLWVEHFRDNARGLVERLASMIRDAAAMTDEVAAAWVAIALMKPARETVLSLLTPRALALLERTPSETRGPWSVRALIALAAPEHLAPLQERRVLSSVEVPTDEQWARVYKDEIATLPPRIRLHHLFEVLEGGGDRLVTALILTPLVVRSAPLSLTRVVPPLLKLLERGEQAPRRSSPPPRIAGPRPFDALLAALREAARLRPSLRSPAITRYVSEQAVEILRAASAARHELEPLARACRELIGHETPSDEMRPILTRWVRDRSAPALLRVDAWRALDLLVGDGGLLEELLVPTAEPETGPLFAVLFHRCEPQRFLQLVREGRLRIDDVPRPEHLFTLEEGTVALSTEARDVIATVVSAEAVVAALEHGDGEGEALGRKVAAAHLARGVFERRSDLGDRLRAALEAIVREGRLRSCDLTVNKHRATLDVQAEALSGLLHFVRGGAGDVVHVGMSAVDALARAVGEGMADTHAVLESERARDLARRFLSFASGQAEDDKHALVAALEDRLATLLAEGSQNLEVLATRVRLYREAAAVIGGPTEAERITKNLTSKLADRAARPGARFIALQVLSAIAAEAGDGEGARAILDDALAMFLDSTEDGALRALIGGIITLERPEAFSELVDMNVQPWTLHRGARSDLPANSLAVNMPSAWLVATLCVARHDEPHHRAVTELVTRMQPRSSRPWEWSQVRAKWIELAGGHAEAVRRGLRSALERSEAWNATGRHAHAARLLALFGADEDRDVLADVAGRMWIDEAPPLDVFWRPAGKSPAFGKYSFLELYLELGFGEQRRLEILAEAYARAAERAEARGEGGTASRYAYEAFLLMPDSPRTKALLDRLNV